MLLGTNITQLAKALVGSRKHQAARLKYFLATLGELAVALALRQLLHRNDVVVRAD